MRQVRINGSSIAISTAALCAASMVQASTWNTTTANAKWSESANWSGGVPNAVDVVADFSTQNYPADRTFLIDGTFTVGTLVFGDADTTSSGHLTLSPQAGSLILSAISPARPTITVGSLGTGKVASISAALSGSRGFVKDGAGTLVLSGANTLTGDTAIKSGAVIAGISSSGTTSGALGASSSVIRLGDTTSGNSNSASLLANNGIAVANPVVASAGSSGALSIGANGSATGTFVGGITLANDLRISTSGSGVTQFTTNGVTGVGNLILNNNSSATGNGGVYFQGSGSTTIPIDITGSITNNGATGSITTLNQVLGSNIATVTQNGGMLVISRATSSGFGAALRVNSGTLRTSAAGVTNASNIVNVASGAVFDIGGFPETVAGVNDLSGGGGTVKNSGAAKLLTIAGSGKYAFGGAVAADMPANLSLTVSLAGTGEQILSGANSYTGATTITSGKLMLGQGGTMAATAVTLTTSGSATAAYGTAYTTSGTTIAGGASLTSTSGTGHTISLADSGTNTLAFAGAGALTANALAFDLGTDHASDQLAFGGAFTGGGVNAFSFTALGNSLTTGTHAYTLATALSGLSTTNFSVPASLTVNGTTYSLSLEGTGASLYLNVISIPEPAALAMVGTALLAMRRRRLA